MSREKLLTTYYQALLDHFGPSDWWPGESPFEVAVGAILTQNTSWRNVEKAIERLREAEALTPASMAALSRDQLEFCLQPSGFFRVKSQRMTAFLQYLQEKSADNDAFLTDGLLACLLDTPTDVLREELLAVSGIGPETADSILLYALARPVFVVDAYTRRMFSRHGCVPDDVSYEELQEFFVDVLPENSELFNEFHALIVRAGKDFCKKSKPLCHACPLGAFLDYDVC